jgi:hypothetical protein
VSTRERAGDVVRQLDVVALANVSGHCQRVYFQGAAAAALPRTRTLWSTHRDALLSTHVPLLSSHVPLEYSRTLIEYTHTS